MAARITAEATTKMTTATTMMMMTTMTMTNKIMTSTTTGKMSGRATRMTGPMASMTTRAGTMLLSLLVTGLLSLSCATPPKPRELDALEKLRGDPQMPAARKKAPDLCKKADKEFEVANDKWQSNDLNDSVNASLMGQIYYRHALALADQDRSNARIAAAEDNLAAVADEQEKAQKDLDDTNEKLGLLQKQVQKDEEMKALEAQMAAEKSASETAETVNAPKYAPEIYKEAQEILAKAKSEMQAGQMQQAQTSATIAKKTAENAAAAAKPSYARDSQTEENRKRADALYAEASRIPGVTVRRDIRGSLQRMIISIAAETLFTRKQTVIAPGKDQVLDPIAELIKKKDYQDFPVQIIGHTDSRGAAQSTLLAMSGARAQSVYNALVTRGVDVRRMMASGQGGAEPIADGRNRASNFRVEVVFLYQ
jgi:outer membrane protein OmpA-like peptidoglycan-associated protein